MNTLISRAAAAALFITLAACSSAPRARVPVGAVPSPDATPLAGRWVGTYTCAQGQTGLTLTMSPGIMGQVSARFDFYAIPGNPSVPSGAYRMTGWLGADGQVALVGVEWIRQPPDYIMVGLSGRLGPNGRTFAGTVPECAAPFSVQRQ